MDILRQLDGDEDGIDIIPTVETTPSKINKLLDKKQESRGKEQRNPGAVS